MVFIFNIFSVKIYCGSFNRVRFSWCQLEKKSIVDTGAAAERRSTDSAFGSTFGPPRFPRHFGRTAGMKSSEKTWFWCWIHFGVGGVFYYFMVMMDPSRTWISWILNDFTIQNTSGYSLETHDTTRHQKPQYVASGRYCDQAKRAKRNLVYQNEVQARVPASLDLAGKLIPDSFSKRKVAWPHEEGMVSNNFECFECKTGTYVSIQMWITQA